MLLVTRADTEAAEAVSDALMVVGLNEDGNASQGEMEMRSPARELPPAACAAALRIPSPERRYASSDRNPLVRGLTWGDVDRETHRRN